MVDLLEKAYNTLSAKYNFTPQGPLSVRNVSGSRRLRSPRRRFAGPWRSGRLLRKSVRDGFADGEELDHFNWGSTLWHEFTHIITLQMTDNKIPRWFSEGLSVFEERKAYPGWGDDMKLDYLKASSTRRSETWASSALAARVRRSFSIANSTTGSCVRSIPGRFWFPTTRLRWSAEYIEGSGDSRQSGTCSLFTRPARIPKQVFKRGAEHQSRRFRYGVSEVDRTTKAASDRSCEVRKAAQRRSGSAGSRRYRQGDRVAEEGR